MGRFVLYDADGKTRDRVLKGRDLEKLFTEGEIVFPTITEEEIQDRSKGDGLARALALFQTTWFVMQSISRHAHGLVVTELEITTLAFAAPNGLMYFFWWNKPLAARYPVPVFLLQKPLERQALKEKGIKLRKPLYHLISHFSFRVRRFRVGPNCAAWSFPFPSDAERILWRVSSLILLSVSEFLLLAVAITGFGREAPVQVRLVFYGHWHTLVCCGKAYSHCRGVCCFTNSPARCTCRGGVNVIPSSHMKNNSDTCLQLFNGFYLHVSPHIVSAII